MGPARMEFFLGSPSPSGFAGLFGPLVQDAGGSVTLLKGTPGCGKSTLLERLAAALEAQGEQVERVRCAGDPDSLDAVVCRARQVCAADATAPHALEPECPVAGENVLSLYSALDRGALRAQHAEIAALYRRSRTLNERAARYITAAGSLLLDTQRTAQCCTDAAKTRALAKALSRRYLPVAAGPAGEEVRFLSALTPRGVVCLAPVTVPALADTVVVVDDALGYAGKLLLGALREEALAKGHRVLSCCCPMSPNDKLEHLFVPALRLAFVTSNSWHPLSFAGQRTIHCTRFYAGEALALRTNRLRFNRNAAQELLAQSAALLAEAAECHRALEGYYTHAMDFARLDAAYAQLAAECGLESGAADPAAAAGAQDGKSAAHAKSAAAADRAKRAKSRKPAESTQRAANAEDTPETAGKR